MSKESDKITSVAVSSGTISAVNLTLTGGTATFRIEAVAALTKPPADHPIYAKIGQVASDWAHVEHTFDELIWEMAGIDPKSGACITAQVMGVFGRCKAILALLTVRQASLGDAYQTLSKRTADISGASNGPGDMRNRIVHDPWYVYPTGQAAQFKAMPHKDHRYGIHIVDDGELTKALDVIRAFAERVTALKTEILTALKSSR